MKIHLAFLCQHNNQGIGGGDRKYGIYYKNLPEEYFEKYMIYITRDKESIRIEGREVIITEDMVVHFCREKNITYVYFGGGKIGKKTEDMLLERSIGLINVNFTSLHTTDSRKVNLIISMTDYWKLKWMHGELSSSYAVYNPIDTDNWQSLREKSKGIYRSKLIGKKHIVGRMARAEPSKWHWLILATLRKLDKEQKYNYGFLFAGMPLLYKKWMSLFLSKKMQSCIVHIPEQREHKDIASFYASIDIFWQTSWIGESFGNVIAEAACFAIPTITDYKAFYKNGVVNPFLYDAQIELVDAGETGAYSATPSGVIRFLDDTSDKERMRLGKHAEKKVHAVYAIKHTVKTLAKTLYKEGRKRGIYDEDTLFEDIEENPNQKTLLDYEKEYGKRVALGEQFDTISSLSRVLYFSSERLWRFIEYIYLAERKILKSYFSFDIEKP